jgi:hypothetical protein
MADHHRLSKFLLIFIITACQNPSSHLHHHGLSKSLFSSSSPHAQQDKHLQMEDMTLQK